MKPVHRAIGETVFAAGLWGYGFIATVYALREFNAILLTSLRFLIPAFLLALALPWAYKSTPWKQYLRQAFVPGLLLGWMVAVLAVGMLFIIVTKSGFIISLFVIIFPSFEAFYFRRRIPPRMWLLIGLGFIGMALISEAHTGTINVGDWLILITAILAAAHIIWFDRHSRGIDKPFLFNGAQCFWAALCVLPILLLAPLPQWNIPRNFISWWGLFFLAIFSTLVAFTIQIRAQKIISATLSGILFLLEAPFAALFAGWLLGERLTVAQWTGAMLIFFAVIAATVESSRQPVR